MAEAVAKKLRHSAELNLWRLVRAMIWMRWRRLVNGTRSGRRGDSFEHLSRVVGAAVPFLFVATMLPTAAVFAFGGWLAGTSIAAAAQSTEPLAGSAALSALRLLLLLIFLLVVLAPLLRSAFSGHQGLVRLLLLPISRRLLHAGELMVGLSDPWLAVIVPGMVLLPVGLLVAGHGFSTLVLAALVLLMLATLLGLSACSGSLCALLFRDRRRAELAALLVMVVLSLVGLLPALLTPNEAAEPPALADERTPAAAEERPAGETTEIDLDLLDALLPPYVAFLPSELFWRGAQHVARGAPLRALGAVAGLLTWFLALYGLSWRLFARRLGQPESQSGRRDVAARGGLEWLALPRVGPGTSAVAWAAAHSALRTVRGKTAVGLNFIIVGLTYAVVVRQFDAQPFPEMGAAVAMAGLVFCLLSLQPVLYNQFAIDRNGLTLQMLSPLAVKSLVRGKLLGGALLLAPAFALCLLAALLVAPGGPLLLWLATLPAALAAYAIYGPMGLVLSASFARSARLERLGSSGNPHSLAGLAATLLAPALTLPSIALALVGQRLLHAPLATFLLVCFWAACALLASLPLMEWAESLVLRRRENLLLVATER